MMGIQPVVEGLLIDIARLCPCPAIFEDGDDMSRGKSTYRKRDLTRALEAARDAGFTVEEFTVETDGKIRVRTSAAATESHVEEEVEGNPFDTLP
jgi:hypothetical protein